MPKGKTIVIPRTEWERRCQVYKNHVNEVDTLELIDMLRDSTVVLISARRRGTEQDLLDADAIQDVIWCIRKELMYRFENERIIAMTVNEFIFMCKNVCKFTVVSPGLMELWSGYDYDVADMPESVAQRKVNRFEFDCMTDEAFQRNYVCTIYAGPAEE